MRRSLLLTLSLALAAPSFVASTARAEDAAEEKNADVEEARKVAETYLEALVKAAEGRKPTPATVSRKLAATRKFIHPKTLEVIKDQEKRKLVTIGVATWHFAKSNYWLSEYEIKAVKPAVDGTVVVETAEKNWLVEEGGIDSEPEQSSYLLGKHGGKWYVVDKRRNGTFDKNAIRLGYKGYFDPVEKPAEAKEKAAE